MLFQFGQADLMLRSGIGEILRLPAEQIDEDRLDVGDGGLVVIEQHREALLMRADVAVR